MSTRSIRRGVRPIILALLAMLVALSLLPTAAQAAHAPDAPARLRAVHAVPDFGAVDIYVNGNKVLGDVTFFTVSPYLEVPEGRYKVQVIPAGESLSNPSLFVINRSYYLKSGRDYTLVARGSVASGRVGPTLLRDDNREPAAGKARVRAAHFSPDAPAVDIFINGEKAIEHLSFRRATGYLEVPAGTYTVGIAPAGGTASNIIYTADLTLEAGKVYTAWANGLLGGAGAQAFKVTPSVDADFAPVVKQARVRAIHAVPDIAGSPVDVYANGVKLVTFDFFAVTDYLTVPAGDYDIRVVLAGGNPQTEAVIQANVTVKGGKDYSIIASGTNGDFCATVLEDDNTLPATGKARVRAAHFSPDAPAVDIFINGARAIENLSFTEATGYLEVPAGTYEVGIAPAGGSPIFTTSLSLEAGKVYTAWANGLLAGTGAKAFKVTPSVDAKAE
ncbi:MAG: DUF4397 domain-containing protein [Oscillochloridaceae bacterium]|nr:DUF4397 domain-containing protein [Chloroflexaceae bacterium]MDW8391478.1 DUF4397 domain-containing protein [Oscillochloridaceae bacterium]